MDEVKLKFTVDAAKAIDATKKQQDEIKKLEKLWDEATDAERKYAAQASKISAWKLANADIGKLTEGWREAGAQIANVTAVLGGLAVAGVAAMAAQEQQEAALRRLGSAYEAVSAATNGVMTAQEALTLQGQIQAAGVRVNSDQLALLARAAREYAHATGNDAAQAVEKLTNAIVNNSEDALSELGLAQARSTSSTQTLANVTRELENRFRGTSPAARTLTEDLHKLPEVLQSIGASAAATAAGGLAAFIDAVNGAGTAARIWQDIVNYRDTQRTLAQQQSSQAVMDNRATARERVLARARTVGARINPESLNGLSEQQLQSVASRLDTAYGTGTQTRAGDMNAAFGAIMANSMGVDATSGLAGIVSTVRREEEMRQRRANMGTAAHVEEWQRTKDGIAKALSNVSDGANSAANAFERAAKRLESAGTQIIDVVGSATEAAGFRGFRNRLQTVGSALGLTASSAEENADLFSGIVDSMEGGGSAARAERERQARISDRNRETRRRAANESAAGRFGALLGVERDDNGNIKPLDGLQTGLNFAQQALPQLVSGFGELWSSIANGSATAGEAFAAFGAKALSTLGNVAIQEGSAMLFKAIPALIEAPPLGAAYLAGGAGLIALGVGLGAAGAAAAPKPSTASANSDSNAARGMRSASLTSGKSGGLGSTTVVLASLVPTGVVDAVNARNSLRQVGRSGLDDGQRIPRRVEH